MHVNSWIRRMPVASGLLAVALVAGCTPEGSGGDATVRGRVTDGNGTQYTRLGGSGSVESAVIVTAYTMADDGSLHTIGSGSVDADGSFEFDVPSGESRVIVAGLDSGDEVVASAILESTGEPGDTVTCTPLDTESSVEAEVMIAMVASAGDVESVDPVDVRVRIDSDTAVEVRATWEDEGEGEAQDAIDALAEASLAAQATQLAAWAEAGFETTPDDMFLAWMDASQELSEDLYAETSSAQAWGEFTSSLAATLEAESGLSEGDMAACDSQGAMALRLVINGRLQGSEIASEATQAASWTEAHSEAMAVAALFAAADATASVQDQAEMAGDDLVMDVSNAASTTALLTAWADFQASMIGDATVQGSALGNHLEADAVTAIAIDAALATCEQSGAMLHDEIFSHVQLLLISPSVDSHEVAAAVVGEWSAHEATVQAAIANAGSAIPTQDAEFATDITLLTTAGFGGIE